MIKTPLVLNLLCAVFVIVFSSCSSDSGSSLSDVSLSSLPSSSSMLAGNGTYGISNSRGGINLQSVSGTPPNLKDLTSTNALSYFWNGVVATINTAGSCSASNRNKFWGQDTSTPGGGGHGACMMAQGVGEALSRMMEGASTMCYMKGITTATSGITVTGATQSDLFKQGSANKTYKISVTGMQTDNRNSPRVSMDVFFTVHGSNGVGGDVYKYDMFMCQSGSITSKETLEVNKSTGTMTATMYNNENSSRGYMQTVAYLTKSGSTITFDKSKSRTAVSKFTGSWGDYLGQVEITSGDLIKAQRYSSSSSWGKNKTYSVSAFAGSGVDDFRFLQGCFKGINTNNAGNQSHSYSGITEYRDTFYAAVASSDLSSQCDSFNFATDGVFADTTIPTIDTTGLNCNMTTDVQVTMDFTDTAVNAIKQTCDGDKRKVSNYSMCDSSSVRTAEGYCRN